MLLQYENYPDQLRCKLCREDLGASTAGGGFNKASFLTDREIAYGKVVLVSLLK